MVTKSPESHSAVPLPGSRLTRAGVPTRRAPPKADMVRLMFDSSVIFALDDEEPELLEDLLAVRHRLVLLLTSAQEHEDLRQSPAAQALGMEHVATSSFVLDESELDDALLGESETFELLLAGNARHTRDALIAESAAHHGATLVMRDRSAKSRLVEAAKEDPALAQFEVWGIAELRSFVQSLFPS